MELTIKDMSKGQKLFTGLFMGLICGVVLGAALTKSAKATAGVDLPATPTYAANDAKLAETTAQPLSETQAPPLTQAADTTAGDGKTVLPESDGKTEIPPDGKETIGKETLPPVGESIGSLPQEVEPGNTSAPPEYLGKAKALLSPPNPVNVSGPVVSEETQ